jgi:ABC-2 type transport system permease protein
VSTLDAVRLVAGREIQVKLKDRAFLIGVGFMLLFTVGGIVLPAVLGGPSTVAVVQGTDWPQLTAAGIELRPVADAAAAEELVRADDVDAAVLPGPALLAMDEAPGDVLRALSVAPPVRLLGESGLDPTLLFLVPFALGFIYYLSGVVSGMQIAQSVAEEKQTRIVEILVASVPVRAMLAGKIVGGVVLGFGQVLLITAGTVIGMRVAGQGDVLTPLLPALGWYLPFYVVGFGMLAAMWAAVGAMVSRQEDLASAATPMTLAVMLPFFAVLGFKSNAAALTVLSYVPLSAPIAMPVRLFLGEAATWEPFVAFGLLTLTAAVLMVVGARLYAGSLLQTGGKVSYAAAWRSRGR